MLYINLINNWKRTFIRFPRNKITDPVKNPLDVGIEILGIDNKAIMRKNNKDRLISKRSHKMKRQTKK